MGWLTKALSVFRRPLSITDPEGWREPTLSYAGEFVSEDSALALSAVWASVNLLSGTQATLPIMVYQTGADGRRKIARDHWAYRLLHDSPNADQTAVDFWEYQGAAIELRGNAYARKVKIGERVVSLDPVNPALMSARRNAAGEIRYSWSNDGRSYEVGQDEMLHIRGFCGSPLGGVSTLTYARNVLGLAKATDKAAGKMFTNGARPSGVLTFQNFLTPEQRQVAEERMANKFLAAENTGRPMILEGGTKWEQISISPEDAQMLESRKFSVEEICRWFGVPPFMVGHTEKSTSWGTGLEQQVLGFVKFTLRRRLKRIEQALEKQLLTAADRAAGDTIEFNLEGLLRGDSAARAAFYQTMTQIGAYTINEVRALENLAPVAGGDVPRMQMQNVPLTGGPEVTP